VKATLQILSAIVLALLLVFVGYLWGHQPSNSSGVSIKESVPVGFSGSNQRMNLDLEQVPCSENCQFRVEVIKLPENTQEERCKTGFNSYSNCILINDANVVDDKCTANPCNYMADVVLEWRATPSKKP
jgi:hypothetical protein